MQASMQRTASQLLAIGDSSLEALATAEELGILRGGLGRPRADGTIDPRPFRDQRGPEPITGGQGRIIRPGYTTSSLFGGFHVAEIPYDPNATILDLEGILGVNFGIADEIQQEDLLVMQQIP